MSTAERETRDDAIQKFVMPLPRIHQVVAHFLHGEKTGNPHPALVLDVNPENVLLMSLSPGQVGAEIGWVSHCDDPFIQGNQYVKRNFGGWDFTEYDKELARQRKFDSERMAALDRKVSALYGELGVQATKGDAKK